MEFTKPTIASELSSETEIPCRALLAARLQHPAVARDDIAQFAALANEQREWFLAIDVLAVLRRVDRDQHVPVVGRNIQHRINVIAARDLAEIIVRDAIGVAVLLVHGGLRSVTVIFVHVADCDDLHMRERQEIFHVVHPLPARADDAHHGAVARRHRAVRAENSRRDDGRECERRAGRHSASLDEIAPTDRSRFHVRVHGARYARDNMRSAASSFTNRSLSGSHFKSRPSCIAMFPR